MRKGKAFLYDGRRPRQFSNIWDISFASQQSHFTRWQMLNVFRAHQGPLDQWPVFKRNVNVVSGKEKGEKRHKKAERWIFQPHMSELGLGERQIVLKPAVSWTRATIVTLIPTIFFVMSGSKEKLLSWIQKMLFQLFYWWIRCHKLKCPKVNFADYSRCILSATGRLNKKKIFSISVGASVLTARSPCGAMSLFSKRSELLKESTHDKLK